MRFKDWDSNLKTRFYILIVFGIMYWMFYPFMLMYFQDSIDKKILGLFLSISALATASVSLLGGYFADTYGRRKMMAIGLFLQAFGLLWMALSFPIASYLSLSPFSLATSVFCGFTLIGISGSIYYPASNAMIADVVEEKYRSRVYTLFYTVINVNVTLGPLIGSLFIPKYLFQFLIVMTVVTVLLGLITLFKMHETLDLSKIIKLPLKDEIKEQVNSYKLIFKDKIFFLLMIYALMTGLAFSQFSNLVPISIKESITAYTLFGKKIEYQHAYSIIVAQNGIMVVLLALIANKLLEKYPRKVAFIISSLLYGIAMFVYGYASSIYNALWFFIIGNALATLAEVATVGASSTFLTSLAPNDKKAKYFASNELFNAIWRAIYPLVITLSGFISEKKGSTVIGNQYAFYLIGIIAFLSIILANYIFNYYEKTVAKHKVVINNHEVDIV